MSVGRGVGPPGVGNGEGDAPGEASPAGTIGWGDPVGRTKNTGPVFGLALGVGVGMGGGVTGEELGWGVALSWTGPVGALGNVGEGPGEGELPPGEPDGDGDAEGVSDGLTCATLESSRSRVAPHELELSSARARDPETSLCAEAALSGKTLVTIAKAHRQKPKLRDPPAAFFSVLPTTKARGRSVRRSRWESKKQGRD